MWGWFGWFWGGERFWDKQHKIDPEDTKPEVGVGTLGEHEEGVAGLGRGLALQEDMGLVGEVWGALGGAVAVP